jgi:hypothetical protein
MVTLCVCVSVSVSVSMSVSVSVCGCTAGPMGMTYGCAGFAAWSYAMECFMHSEFMANSSLAGGERD